MAGSLSDALTIARSGVLTHQTRLSVISHNIANVDTPGYHKQKAVLTTTPPNEPNLYESRRWSLGAGVTIDSILRLENNMREAALRDSISDGGRHAQLADSLGDLEALLDGNGDVSLLTLMSKFWTSWQDLANNADRIAFRNTLIESAASLVGEFNRLAENLDTFRARIAAGAPGAATGAAANKIDSINQMVSRVQSLNIQIRSAENGQYSAGDLKDRRDLLVRELSDAIGVSVGADYTLSLDGQILVSGDGSVLNTLALIDPTANPLQLEVGGVPVFVGGYPSGTLGGLLEAAGVAVDLRGRIDTIAAELIAQVNAIHNSPTAFDLDGNPGIDFFVGANAGDIAINPLIYDPADPMNTNPRLIAAANTLYDPGPPPQPNVLDGANALEIADLCRALIPGLGDQTFNDYFSGLLSGLGARVREATDLASDADTVSLALQGAIESETGVNLDEELMEMINAQRAFQACARVVTTIDEMLIQLITRMGA